MKFPALYYFYKDKLSTKIQKIKAQVNVYCDLIVDIYFEARSKVNKNPIKKLDQS